jgi:methylmalonyl-CoA mutase C-terminal domain/subunit
VDEDVDAVGLSILSGSHKELVADTIAALKEQNASDIALFVGGTIPSEDVDALLTMGVKAVFTADMKLGDVIAAVARGLA